MPVLPYPAPRHLAALAVCCALVLPACGSADGGDSAERKRVVVSFPLLASLVEEVVGEAAEVTVLMPAGSDPHEWEPSAKDVESIHRADLVVVNGLGLEAGIADALSEARARGVPVFESTDHVQVRSPGGEGEGDPHIWTDPLAMASVARALGDDLDRVGIDAASSASRSVAQLEALHAEIVSMLAAVPAENRTLVTGHESLGYFADRYGFTLAGTVVPGLTSQGETSAADLGALRDTVAREGVRAIFVETAGPGQLVDTVASETGVAVVELPSHTVSGDGSYYTYMREIAATIAGALR